MSGNKNFVLGVYSDEDVLMDAIKKALVIETPEVRSPFALHSNEEDSRKAEDVLIELSPAAPVDVAGFAVVDAREHWVFLRGSEWSYLDDGTDQGIAWRQQEFDATSWASGAGPLGYGDDFIATVDAAYDAARDDCYLLFYFKAIALCFLTLTIIQRRTFNFRT